MKADTRGRLESLPVGSCSPCGGKNILLGVYNHWLTLCCLMVLFMRPTSLRNPPKWQFCKSGLNLLCPCGMLGKSRHTAFFFFFWRNRSSSSPFRMAADRYTLLKMSSQSKFIQHRGDNHESADNQRVQWDAQGLLIIPWSDGKY